MINTVRRRVKEVLVTKYKDIGAEKNKRKKSKGIQILAPMVMHSFLSTKEEIQQYLIAFEGNIPISDI
ncbi:4654_t:CDS:2 [Diversispora eburnea]|uniref:4654_t:CDS:1 n=1 Tax=Diversispora eburnea TaxID=1213867 RepID=A0A9N9GWS6_9GLOM|nr:4654_t:CDS:2 [Diversispora eburnea]